MNIDRRSALRLAAAASGAVAAGAVTGARPAQAATGTWIHIHGELKETPDSLAGGQIVKNRLINIDVAGTDDDLCGGGYDTDNPQPSRFDPTFCYWTARGSVSGDMVTLEGKAVDGQPLEYGNTMKFVGNVATGEMQWSLGTAFKFAGTGLVIRV